MKFAAKQLAMVGIIVLLAAVQQASAQVFDGQSDGYGPWTNYAPWAGHFQTAYDEAYDHYEASKASLEDMGWTVEYWGNDAWTDGSGPYRAKVRIYWIYY